MKKLVVFSLLLIVATFCVAQEIEFIRWHIQPTTIEFSYYDYQNGAYDGYPVRFQNISDPNAGLWMTFMSSPGQSNTKRRQRWAYASLDGASLDTGYVNLEDHTGTFDYPEGFGTLAIDTETGNPFFVWHANFTNTDGAYPVNAWFNYDLFHTSGVPGYSPMPRAVVADNEAQAIYPADDRQFLYQWPVIHIGPSPIAGKKRIYVFTSNGGYAPYMTANNIALGRKAMPSSSVQLSIADYDLSTFDLLPEDVVWTHKDLPYFIDIHYHAPTMEQTTNYEGNARAYQSYAVSPSGQVAVAGIQTNQEHGFLGLPEHDHFVLLDNNYGEFNVGEYQLYTKLYERFTFAGTENEGQGPILREYTDPDTGVTETDVPLFDDPEDPRFAFKMTTQTVNHKTVIFDRFGNIQFPTAFQNNYKTLGLEPGYTNLFYGAETVNNIVFDPRTAEWKLYTYDPLRGNGNQVGYTDEVPFPWDLDDDGYIDEDILSFNEDGQIVNWHQTIWPNLWGLHPTEEHSNRFQYNQHRLTFDNNGWMAKMWVDGTKQYLYKEDNVSDYQLFADQTEIMIAVSRDSGRNWTKPFRMNALVNSETNPDGYPEIGNRPSYVYPAEKLIPLSEDTARLYFMYYSDNSLASQATWTGGGPVDGGFIKYAALDFRTSVQSDKETPFIKPIAMLGQNYPNPFNPTTSIKFNIPKAGDVNLNVYNVKGQHVKTLVSGKMAAGEHTVTWSGNDKNERSVASGIYFYKLETNGKSEMKKMLLMK